MATVKLSDLLEIEIPKGQNKASLDELQRAIEKLNPEYGNIYSSEGFDGSIYHFRNYTELKSFLNSLGFPKETPDKYYEPVIKNWYENKTQTPEYSTETTTEVPRPEGLNNTTLTSDQLETIGEFADDRAQQKADIRSREKQTIDDFIENYQKKIKEVQSAQSEFENKVVYAKVEVDPKDDIKKEQLEADQQKKIEHYEDLVKQEKFETAKQELAAEIVQKAEKELLKQGITKEEIKNIARETASEAVEVLSHKNEDTYTPPTYQTVILATVATDTTILPKIVSSKAVELVKSSANNVSVFRIQPEVLTRSILTTAFGDQFTTVILGVDPSKIKVSITNTLPQNLERDQLVEYREVRLSEVNKHQIDIYQGQINALNAISDKGREITTGYVQSNITGFLSRKIESLPAGSVIKKLTSTPEMQAVLFAKFGVGNPVTWQYANPVLMRVMGQNQLAGAFFSTVSKATGNQIVTSVTAKATSEVAAGAAVKTGVGASLSATLSATFGSFAPVVGHIIGAIVGYVGGELFSKAKVWWQKNKEKVKPVLAVGATIAAIRFLGVGPGLGVGGAVTFGLMGTVGLSTIAFGGVRLLGLIGRSAMITISTPVIVTLLVLPPLVAFIMLVINNSAYVVPPSPYSSSLNGGADNPYMLVTKTANPTKLDNSSSNQTVIYVVSIKALKGNLTNLKLVSTECSVIKKDKSKVECPTEFISDLDGASITPGNDGVFSFTGIYGPKYSDSLIYDRITISATNEAGEEITTSGSESVCIGNCPTDCLTVEGPWPAQQKLNIEKAREYIIANNSDYVAHVCSQYPDGLPLKYGGSNGNLWGYFKGTHLLFYGKGTDSESNAIYTLTHEMLHALVTDLKAVEIYLKYIASAAITETPRCFYSYEAYKLEERLADAVAFSIMPVRYCSITGKDSNINQWPKHRDFILKEVFNVN